MRLEEIRELVARRLGFNQGSVDQDFDGTTNEPWKWIDKLINEAIRDEYREIYSDVGHYPFEESITSTWPQSQVTYKLPVKPHQVVAIFDVTDDVRGEVILFGERFTNASLIWRDKDTLEWGETGPGSDLDLRIQYIAEPDELVQPTDSPDIIPEVYHDLFVWAALCIARLESDEETPDAWLARRRDLRSQAIKHLSQKRPKVTGPRRFWVRESQYLS